MGANKSWISLHVQYLISPRHWCRERTGVTATHPYFGYVPVFGYFDENHFTEVAHY